MIPSLPNETMEQFKVEKELLWACRDALGTITHHPSLQGEEQHRWPTAQTIALLRKVIQRAEQQAETQKVERAVDDVLTGLLIKARSRVFSGRQQDMDFVDSVLRACQKRQYSSSLSREDHAALIARLLDMATALRASGYQPDEADAETVELALAALRGDR